MAGTGQKAEALVLSRQAIEGATVALRADSANAFAQAALSTVYAAAGAVQVKFAVTRAEWMQALDWYQKSAEGWEHVHPQHGWPDNRDSELARVKAEILRCARKLTSL